MNKDEFRLWREIEKAKYRFEQKYTVVQVEGDFTLDDKGYSKADVVEVSDHYLLTYDCPQKYIAVRSLNFATVDKVRKNIAGTNPSNFLTGVAPKTIIKRTKLNNTVLNLKKMNKDEVKLRQAISNAKKEFERDYTIVYLKGDYDEHVYSEDLVVELSPSAGYVTYNRDEIILGVKSKDFYAVWRMMKHITDAKFSFTCGRMIIDSKTNMERFDKNLFVKNQEQKVVIPDVGEGYISSIITDDKYPIHVTIDKYFDNFSGRVPQVMKFKLTGVAENLNLAPKKLAFEAEWHNQMQQD